MKTDKVVVFGGAGFLGGYVVEELLKREYQVTVADINKGKYIGNCNFIKCDIQDFEAVKAAIGSADIVYNFAGFANLERAADSPKRTMELNILGNLNVLEAARINNCKHFIFASSAYAMSDKGSFYGISKLSSEKIVEEYRKKYGLPFTIIRYGSVYSERDFDNNYIYNLIKKAYRTQEIDHKGDGNEIREYIHAADAASLSVDIIENKDFLNQHIILTGFERMQRKELFDMINEIMGNRIAIKLSGSEYNNHYKTTPYSLQPNVSKKLINNPFIDIGQGILQCIQSIENSENE